MDLVGDISGDVGVGVGMMQVDGMFLYLFSRFCFIYILFFMNVTEEATTPNAQGEAVNVFGPLTLNSLDSMWLE
jgi:hypothetical protein